MPTYVERRVKRKYIADGALDINATNVHIGGGSATALTLVDPPNSPGWNGHQITVTAVTAQAHTVTNTTGFNNGGSSNDVATFGGAVGDTMVIEAAEGVWNVVNLRNVTLG